MIFLVPLQDLQSDVFGGGGMGGGKFWDMYKGKSSYDSFDESDGDIVDSLGMDADESSEMDDMDLDAARQAAEVDQPEDRYRKMKKEKDETIIVALRVRDRTKHCQMDHLNMHHYLSDSEFPEIDIGHFSFFDSFTFCKIQEA